MGLVTPKEVAQAINLSKYGFAGTFIGWLLMKVTRLSSMNRFYEAHKHLEGIEFLDAILKHYSIDFSIPEEDLKRLPKEGPFITISNHPLGGIDGVLLLKIIGSIRPDFKILGNFLLHRVTPMEPYILAVNPFQNKKNIKSSIPGFKSALSHLQEGAPLGIFPAGEVSTIKKGTLVIDKVWEEPVLKLIRKAQVPIVPLYFHAKNSSLFYRLAKINDVFRTAKLPSELYSQKKRPIKIRIGYPIQVETQNKQESLSDFSKLLRKKTYLLCSAYAKERYKNPIPTSITPPKAPKKIANAVPYEVMAEEIEKLREKKCRLLKHHNYEVFLAQKKDMPYLLTEIGRQRELTFRAIGEGTNNALDLDVYDQYYHHLFLWDTTKKGVVGAYRMGMGAEIFSEHGIRGFYLQDLFRIAPELYSMMQNSIEMGRAYIIKEYQQKPMPLFLLWKGIIHTTLRYPNYQYLIGGVSISTRFSDFSKAIMAAFMKDYYWDPTVAQYISPKKEFKAQINDADKTFVFKETQADINKLDRLINELEPGNLRVPVLIKKYLKQNAKVIAFNVDPLFNNAVDALMYIKITDLPEQTVKPVMEEFQGKLA